MKILAIRGSNLASLVGDFELRLDEEPLGPTGLFAISGPTGSGKSTLLDAMCLALYARTPRLDTKASSSVNALVGRADEDASLRLKSQDPRGLLSRGCGIGHAEVDFLGQDRRRYRARWTVRRSRNRPDGRYQAEQISLTDLESGQTLGEHKKDSLESIQQRLGLDYDQFRRSVLLAQGDFAAFLEAEPSERGALLESITGMEIYSRLSKAAHERAKKEKADLELLTRESEGWETLSDEVRGELEKQEAQRTLSQATLEKERQALARAVDWYENQARLAELEVQARQDLWGSLRALRDQTGLPVAEWESLEGEPCPAEPLLALWRRMQRHLADEVESLAQSEAELLEWKRGQARLAKDCEQAEKEAAEIEKALTESEQVYARLVKEGLELDAWFAAHEDWKDLCTQWPRWKESLDRARDVAFDLSEALRVKAANEASLRVYKDGLVEAQAEHEAASARQVQAAEVLAAVQRQMAELDLEALLAEQARVGKRRLAIADLLRSSLRWHELGASRRQALEEAEEQAQLVTRTHEERRRVEVEKASSEAARIEAQRQLDSIRERASLEDHRKNLEPGEPCPLCGSLEHPFAGEAVLDLADEALERTVDLGKQVQQAGEMLQSLAQQLGTQMAAEKEALRRAEAAEQERAVVEKAAQQAIDEHRAVWADDERPSLACNEEALEALRLGLEAEELSEFELGQRIEERSRLEERQKLLVADRDEELARSHAILDKRRGLEVDLQRAELDIQHAEKEARRLDVELARLLEALDAPLRARPGWRDLFHGERDLLFELLEQQSLDWDEKQVTKARITDQRSELEAGREGLRVQGLERRKRADSVGADKLQLETAIADREADLGKRLGGTGSARLRTLLAEADNKAVLVQERDVRVQKHAEDRPALAEEDCRSAMAAKSAALEALREEIESLRFRLRSDRDAREKLSAMHPRIQAQRERSENWTELADLIGSYDGRKFRDFAQSLSLDAMVSQANHHLAGLAARYRLQRVPGQDLDLQIVDLYMGDEVRGVHSLSGGESFLVSLALALGLSSMHASHCSLESLFIDEGFGSLDEESLETAIAALDALQATGRQIGLISHVSGLAERIGREVRVRPLGGGRSLLEY